MSFNLLNLFKKKKLLRIKNSKFKKKNLKSKDKKSKVESKKKKLSYFSIILIKVILILFIVSLYYYINSSYSNTISLLAVNEDDNGNLIGGSIINLSLKVIPGSGNIFVNLNTIEEVDTQISIINSNKIACDLFRLDCENYDFYYDFKGSALVLKGPSASSAIAILTAKTLNKEKLNKYSVITGSLNSGGVIGNVGGIDEKIKVAETMGFSKVIIPLFSNYNMTQKHSIEIIKSLDLVDAYNKFNNDNFELKKYPINSTAYEILMKGLAKDMCDRSIYLKNLVESKNINITNTSKEFKYYKQAEKSFNSSLIALNNSNYYSMGSFCYNSNINYRIVLELENNYSFENLDLKAIKLEEEINKKIKLIDSDELRSNIKTINDFYTYLLLNNRIDDAKEYLEKFYKIKYEIINDSINSIESNELNESNNESESINNSNSSIIITYKNNNNKNESKIFNITSNSIENKKINETSIKIKNSYLFEQKISLYSTALERFYSVNLWEKFINHEGSKIKFDNDKVSEVCSIINRQVLIKEELLKKYGILFLNEDINKQLRFNNPFSNKYLCIYNGLELNGRVNTLLNSVGIDEEDKLNYSKILFNFTKNRLSLNSNGDFPLIPYIYTEYAGDLIRENNSMSSMLYSNYALSYLDLNLYLKEKNKVSILNQIIRELYENLIFLTALLFLVSFIGVA